MINKQNTPQKNQEIGSKIGVWNPVKWAAMMTFCLCMIGCASVKYVSAPSGAADAVICNKCAGEGKLEVKCSNCGGQGFTLVMLPGMSPYTPNTFVWRNDCGNRNLLTRCIVQTSP